MEPDSRDRRITFGIDSKEAFQRIPKKAKVSANGTISPGKKRKTQRMEVNPEPAVFGQPLITRSGYSPDREEIKRTTVPIKTQTETEQKKIPKKALKPGDPFTVYPGLLTYDGLYGTEGVKEQSVIESKEQLTIVGIHRPGRGVTYELAHRGSNDPLSHVFIARVGGHWMRAKTTK